MIKVKVPATSANFGSGFDCIGIALNKFNTISFAENDSIIITNSSDFPTRRDKSNLIYKTVDYIYKINGKTLKGLKIHEQSEIPKTRGLGSSAACIVAGVVGANVLLGGPLLIDDMINIAAHLEGHPDNTTPAIVGGLTVSSLEKNKVHYVKVPIKTPLSFIALIPDFKIRTEDARNVLPAGLLLKDASFNLARSALLVSSIMTGELHNLSIATDDTISTPYRKDLIPNADEIMSLCRDLGALTTYISGAGPTIMAICKASDHALFPSIQTAMAERFPNWKTMLFRVDLTGHSVI